MELREKIFDIIEGFVLKIIFFALVTTSMASRGGGLQVAYSVARPKRGRLERTRGRFHRTAGQHRWMQYEGSSDLCCFPHRSEGGFLQYQTSTTQRIKCTCAPFLTQHFMINQGQYSSFQEVKLADVIAAIRSLVSSNVSTLPMTSPHVIFERVQM